MRAKFAFPLIAGVMLAIMVAGPGHSMGWMNLVSASIDHVDQDVYRLLAAFDWGGDPYIDPSSGHHVNPVFDRLLIGNLLGEPVDWTYNHTGGMGYSYAGDWFGGIYPADLGGGASGLYGPEFGWDFRYDGPQGATFSLPYLAVLTWQEYDYGESRSLGGFSEQFEGTMTVTMNAMGASAVIPEPATAALLGLGLAGLIVCRRTRSK
jgi:hypothetical protein